VAGAHAIVVDDVLQDPRYVEVVPGSRSELAVPLRRKNKVIGALVLLSENAGQYTARDEAMLRQFGAHVAVALENARLFDRERQYSATLETLAEIGREVASILDLDELLDPHRRADAALRRLPHLRHPPAERGDQELEMKLAIRYGDKLAVPNVKMGRGSSAMRRCTASR
jgi:phosphoserine phosphatase RsbU/P